MANRAHRTAGRHKPKPIPIIHHKHYWPYIPVLIMVVAIFSMHLFQPLISRSVLAYATEMSTSQLLSATNAKRATAGSGQLTINAQLNSAAQAKANDMIARNYWSHNTPDGKEPWTFFDAAGYKYFKAGENLAYGFSTSNATVEGWMNSPTHKENLLDTAFTEVGFGFANGESYNNSGPETVVVAEYGRPQVLAESSTSQAPPQEQATAPTAKPAEPSQTPVQTAENSSKSVEKPVVVNSDTVQPAKSNSVPISRIQSFASGKPWLVFATGLLTGIAVAVLLIKHVLALRHFIKDTEKFVLHHPLLDTLLVGVILIGSFMMQTTGFLK